ELSHGGLTVDALERQLGFEFDVLLGADVLHSVWFSIDWQAQLVSFSSEPIAFEGTVLPVEKVRKAPIVPLQIGAEIPIRAFVDTGAKFSYLHRELTQGFPLE